MIEHCNYKNQKTRVCHLHTMREENKTEVSEYRPGAHNQIFLLCNNICKNNQITKDTYKERQHWYVFNTQQVKYVRFCQNSSLAWTDFTKIYQWPSRMAVFSKSLVCRHLSLMTTDHGTTGSKGWAKGQNTGINILQVSLYWQCLVKSELATRGRLLHSPLWKVFIVRLVVSFLFKASTPNGTLSLGSCIGLRISSYL